MSVEIKGGRIISKGIGSPVIPCRGGYVSNIGLDLTSGVLKIVQANGDDLTAANEGHICMSSTTAGEIVYLTVEDALNLVEDASGTHDFGSGEFFGKTIGGSGWTSEMPLFLYVINSDDTKSGLKFALSPDPTRTNSPPTAARSGYHGNPTSGNVDNSFFYLTSTDITSTHVNKPCMLIGSVRATVNTSGQWTFTTLALQDGIGHYQEEFWFNFDKDQNGAEVDYTTAGTSNGVSFSSNTYKYKIDIDGWVDLSIGLENDGGTETNANNGLGLIAPYANVTGSPSNVIVGHALINSGGITNKDCMMYFSSTPGFRMSMFRTDINDVVKDSSFANGDSRYIRASVRYKAF